MIVFAYYCALNITFLLLHNALAMRNGAQFKLSTHGGMTRCPLYVFSVLLVGILIIAIVICFLNATQLSFWTSYLMFVIIHLSTVDMVLEIILYICCSFVQVFKIWNFFGEKTRNYIKPQAILGLIFSFIMLSLFIIHIVCIIWYPTKEALAWLNIVSLYWQTAIILPLMHFMVIRQ